ncbi:MAG: hypothetical protein E5V33_10690 [Mesorhizobium sp.]|nr:MAG: hypothetical protein E5V33_10690 [Mesorhizobium sp.]
MDFPFILPVGDPRQNLIQAFLLDDLTAINSRQGDAIVHDLEPSIRIVANKNFRTSRALCELSRLQDEKHLVVAQRKSLGQFTDLLMAHGSVEILVFGERPMKLG